MRSIERQLIGFIPRLSYRTGTGSDRIVTLDCGSNPVATAPGSVTYAGREALYRMLPGYARQFRGLTVSERTRNRLDCFSRGPKLRLVRSYRLIGGSDPIA